MFVCAFRIILLFPRNECIEESGEIERKGTLVKERRIKISLSSRRGFVLHQLPSAPLHPHPILSFLGNPCYSELSIVELAMRRLCMWVCVFVQDRACSPLQCEVTYSVCFRGCADSDSALLVLPALHCADFSSPRCGSAEDIWLVSTHCRHLCTGCMWNHVGLIPSDLAHYNKKRILPMSAFGGYVLRLLEFAAVLCRCSKVSLWITDFIRPLSE